MDVLGHIEGFRKRFAEVEEALSDPNVYADKKRYSDLGKEFARLKETLAAAEEHRHVRGQIAENETLLAAEKDAAMRQMIQGELESLRKREAELFLVLERAVLPPDPNDSRNTILEIRAGAGGEEAALFAADLCRMYTKYAESHGWKIEIMDVSPSERGGLKEVIFSVIGENVFRKLRYESGVHRVQRVPVTEAGGRIHTSTVTVAILPEAEEIEVEINPEELRIDVFRSGGPGGQSVNTTDSAVRVTHLPTGIVVSCQDEKSQHKNRAKALRVLRARLLDQAKQQQQEKISRERRTQIGSGDRSERIRTYNFPQGRVTDHRINVTLYKLASVLEGEMEELIEPLRQADQAERLKDLSQGESER